MTSRFNFSCLPVGARAVFTILALAATGCAGPSADTEALETAAVETVKPTHDHGAVRTVKAGAAVEFTYELNARPELDREGVATIVINHQYSDATIVLTATGEDGVDISSADAGKTVYVDRPGSLMWELRFTPRTTGVNYINVFANVRQADGLQSTRTSAIRIATGDETAQKIGSDVKEVILNAQETIID